MYKAHILFVPFIAASLGCDESSTDDTTAASRAALYACEERAFVGQRPLMGPGFDPARGGLLGETQPSYVVFASQAYPKPEQRERFGSYVRAISAQLDASPGALAHALGTDAVCGVGRTLSLWANEAALFDFATTGAHADAMSRGSEYFISFKTTYWSIAADDVSSIDWDDGRAKLEEAEPIWFDGA
jgi:hypothetical protein